MTKKKNMLVWLSKMKWFLPSIFGRMFFADAGKRELQQSLTLAVDWLDCSIDLVGLLIVKGKSKPKTS
jgi:hypothetical protein